MTTPTAAPPATLLPVPQPGSLPTAPTIAAPTTAAPAAGPSRSSGPRLTTPRLVRAAMLAAVVPVGLLALAIEAGVSRVDRTVETIGQDAARGITVAQDIRADLAALDTTVAESLLVGVDPEALGDSGYPESYNTERRALQDELVEAASRVTDPAYRNYLVNIDYALAHYHALVRAAFVDSASGQPPLALADYRAAHAVMAETLLPQADGFDKANTYVLNQAYERHDRDQGDRVGWIVASGLFLLAFLLVVQVVVAWRFRRILNPALLGATLLVVAAMGYSLARLDTASDRLTQARADAFDEVHTLARARAAATAAHQAETRLVLDPADPAAAEDAFEAYTENLFRLPDESPAEVADAAAGGEAPPEASGYLASVVESAVRDGVFTDEEEAAEQALERFGDFLNRGQVIKEDIERGNPEAARAAYDVGTSFEPLLDALDRAQRLNQEAFDERVAAAAGALDRVDLIGFGLAGLVLVLTLVGLYPRLREYS